MPVTNPCAIHAQSMHTPLTHHEHSSNNPCTFLQQSMHNPSTTILSITTIHHHTGDINHFHADKNQTNNILNPDAVTRTSTSNTVNTTTSGTPLFTRTWTLTPTMNQRRLYVDQQTLTLTPMMTPTMTIKPCHPSVIPITPSLTLR